MRAKLQSCRHDYSGRALFFLLPVLRTASSQKVQSVEKLLVCISVYRNNWCGGALFSERVHHGKMGY